MIHKFSIKPEIYYSKNSITCLQNRNLKRLFIIIDPFMKETGLDKIIEDTFKDEKEIVFKYFTKIEPDSPIELVTEGVSEILKFQPDSILAVGGGSAIDESKAIMLMYTRIMEKQDEKFKKPLFAVIPTTSGTGSEVTNFSIITIDGKKNVLVDDLFLPDIAILDVTFTKSLPLHILADTSIDALTHALEAFVSKNDSDCADAFAEKAIKLIFKYLREIFEVGDSIEARTRLHNASCIAGMAFTNASLGINHSMSHALGGIFNVPHGKANAVFLTKTLEFNSQEEYVEKKIKVLCSEMGLCDGESSVKIFLNAIEDLLLTCNMPIHVKDLDISLDDYLKNIFELSQRALEDKCTLTNPVSPNQDDLMRLFINSYEKKG